MPKICYVSKKFNATHEIIIERANAIIAELSKYNLTLRQLYYQYVSRDWFPEAWKDPKTGSTNNERSYDKLGTILSDARRAGRVDWNAIVDRTRNVKRPPAWDDPAELVAACASQFAIDYWRDQPYRPEVWVEKDALVGVLEVACQPWRCPYFSCRGYTSDSEIWSAAQRLKAYADGGQTPIVYHLGDHDPSGVDMSRDIADRLTMFARRTITVKRIALTMGQIEQYNPPPNPAKSTDARYAKYRDEYGDESWELDALSPETIAALVATEMEQIVDQTEWAAAGVRQAEGRRLLAAVSDDWDNLTEGL